MIWRAVLAILRLNVERCANAFERVDQLVEAEMEPREADVVLGAQRLKRLEPFHVHQAGDHDGIDRAV